MHIEINQTEAGFDVCVIDSAGQVLKQYSYTTLERARAAARAERRMLEEWRTLSARERNVRANRNELEEYLLLARNMGWACIDGVRRNRTVRPPWATATGDRWVISDKQLYKFCWKKRITVERVVAKAIARGWKIEQTPEGYAVTWTPEPVKKNIRLLASGPPASPL